MKRRLSDGNRRPIRRGATETKLDLARRLRDEPTPAEALLWDAVRARRLAGFKFRRQHVIAGYIADFYCSALHLVIELDGESHSGRAAVDARRTVVLARLGVTTLRFPNDAVLHTLDAVLTTIRAACFQLANLCSLPPQMGGKGSG